MQLRDLQLAFTSAMSGEADGALLASIVSRGAGRNERLAVYRNNMHHNYCEALRAVYPVVERLVGNRFFLYAADSYLRRFPSTSGDIHGYGDQFPRFLSGFPPAAQLAYLPDVARLEWMMHEVFHAPDHAPLVVARLQAVSQAHYAALRMTLHPACRLLSSSYPVHTIWKMNQASAEWDGMLDVGGEGVSLLIRRSDDFSVELIPLAPAEYAMLRSLSQGEPFGAACESALQADARMDLSRFILRHVADGTIVDFHAGIETMQDPGK